MNSIPANFTFTFSKTPPIYKRAPAIDNLPEEAASSVAKWIAEWAEISGNEDERDRGRRARDSALRAVSLSSRKAKALWHPLLIKNVAFSLVSLISVYTMVEGGNIDGSKIKSITSSHPTISHTQLMEALHQIHQLSPFKSDEDSTLQTQIGLRELIQRIYEKLDCLQVVVIAEARLTFSLRKGRSFSPLPFLTRSLKKLFIAKPGHSYPGFAISATNVVWLMCFCENLRKLSIGFVLTLKDHRFLSEFYESFAGISKVKELSISPEFFQDPNMVGNWWGRPKGNEEKWKGDNRKAEALFFLLSAASQLYSFEIAGDDVAVNRGDRTSFDLSCCRSLQRTTSALKHLGLFGLDEQLFDNPSQDLTVFKNLSHFTLDLTILNSLWNRRMENFFPGLQTVALAHYFPLENNALHERFLEDRFLADFISGSVLFSSVKELIVPNEPLNPDGQVLKENRARWNMSREYLENSERLKSGEVMLTRWSFENDNGAASEETSRDRSRFAQLTWPEVRR